MIKYGLKLWSTNRHLFDEAVRLVRTGQADFVELYVVPDKFSLTDLEPLKKITVSIHTPHYGHQFNIFNLDEKAMDIFKNQVIAAADYFNSEFIILHAGVGEDKEVFRENINKIKDRRIIIENKPRIGMDDVRCFGYSLDQLKFIKEECGLDICLDFAHAAESAFSQKIDYKVFWQKIIDELSPAYFHLSDDFPGNEKDEHLNLESGGLDLKLIKNMLEGLEAKRDISLVFETPKLGNKLENDLINIDYFKNL